MPTGDIVESANPPVANPAKLAWVLHGPSSVSYTLLDTSQQNDDTFRLTLAGITAALAASILVALIAAIPPALGGRSGARRGEHSRRRSQ